MIQSFNRGIKGGEVKAGSLPEKDRTGAIKEGHYILQLI